MRISDGSSDVCSSDLLWLVFAMNAWMVVTGFFLVGLAVGADIPASWSLIAEMAPNDKRGKHSGVAQVLWYLGPVVVLLMFLALSSLGLLGARIVFAHLAILAVALTFLRSRMHESPRWLEAQAAEANGEGKSAESEEGRVGTECVSKCRTGWVREYS